VGRPRLTRHGVLMAAVLASGPSAVVSHRAAAELWGLVLPRARKTELTVPRGADRHVEGLRLHRRDLPSCDLAVRHGIPATGVARMLLDLGTVLVPGRHEHAINEADKLDLIDPEALRAEAERFAGQPGAPALRAILDRATFTLTDSELERLFLPIARRAGLGRPETGISPHGFRVDFAWMDLGLLVETDGLRYHRTPAQQARDRLRDQVHAAAGLTTLRFTHAQVACEPRHVEGILRAVARRLAAARA